LAQAVDLRLGPSNRVLTKPFYIFLMQMLRVILFGALPSVAFAGNTATCIENTGGGCVTGGCLSWRGSTRCDGGRCFCNAGTCAGTDEVCYTSIHPNVPYTQITSGSETLYELQNARWPNYFLYVTSTGGVAASTDHDDDTSDFTISQPPSDSGATNAMTVKSYLVFSRKWPSASVYTTNADNGQAVTCQNVNGGMGGMMNDPAINDLTLTFTKAPVDNLPEMIAKNQTLVMLSTPKYADQYIYLSTMSWTASAYKNDPGAGGYWYIKTISGEIPLPMSIQDSMMKYAGPRCSSMCGKASSKAHSTHHPGLALVWASLAAAAAVAFI